MHKRIVEQSLSLILILIAALFVWLSGLTTADTLIVCKCDESHMFYFFVGRDEFEHEWIEGKERVFCEMPRV